MSGHSKWANIKRRKGAQDVVRGKIFTKLNKEIMVAAKIGGGDPDGNPRLRAAIIKARAANMPMQNIERAIKKGTGDLDGVNYEEITYEGYGPAGVAIMVETLTDNRNRTVSDVRYTFTRHNGNLGETGCVSWIFQMRSYFVFSREDTDGDTLVEIALEAGAEDITEEGQDFEVYGPPESFDSLSSAFDKAELKYQVGEVTMIPQNTINLDEKQAEQTLKLVESLEDNDDVQRVYANFDISDDIMEKM
ncbi:MAG: YebC/PmpR family DNA-binding transcriptional regulator [bacterium]|nr:YebC/PmpR family DNA-binding transcriptional regulator [bacterium]MDT8367153.1 YebC/PmpR family DNA-binding transcriptional regulator [bacterium]